MDKEHIINTAFNMIVKDGLEEFSIGKLAAELECSKSSLYNYFKSKQDLLNQLFIDQIRKLSEGIDQRASAEEMLRQYAHNSIKNSDVFVFFHKYSQSKFINKDTITELKCNNDIVCGVAKKFHNDNEYRKLNPIIIDALVIGPIHGFVMLSRKKADYVVNDDDINCLVDMIITSIKKEKNE